MFKHNAQSTGLDYMEATLSYLALQGWYNIDLTKVFNQLSTTDKWQNTHRAYLWHLQHSQDEPFFCHVSPQVHYLRETHVWGVCTSIKSTSLRAASEGFRIPHCEQIFPPIIHDDWWHEVSGPVFRYDQNVLFDSIFMKLQNGLSYYSQPFHCPTSVEHLRLDSKM
jgi:hypothetical protein